MLAVVMLCSSSFGQTNWVRRFFEGYPRPQSPPGTAPEVRNAYTQLEMNRSRITTAGTARELAARRLDAEQKKFELGTSTVRFALEEQRNVAQAETNEIQALVNYTKALVALDRAIGNTLARNNIELDKQLPKELASSN